jgi:hypothetical protein
MKPFNPELINDLAKQRVVVFVGAGVSASAETRSGGKIKNWEEFLRYCCDSNLDRKTKRLVISLIQKYDYLSACELLKKHHGDQWKEMIRAEFGQLATPSELHQAVIGLDQRIYITTNFDKLLEDAWRDLDSAATHHPQFFSKPSPAAFKIFRDDGKYIVKLHGDIDNIDEMVFSKAEYIRGAIENDYYAMFMSTLFLSFTCLFIGFSMSDPAVTQLIERYAFKFPNGRPHYLFTPTKISDDMVELNKEIRKLYLLFYSPKNNHKELLGNLNGLIEQMKIRRKEIAAEIAAT